MASKSEAANDREDDLDVAFGNIDDRLSQELVVAFVGPVGSGCSTVCDEVGRKLKDDFGYDIVPIGLSSLIREHASDVDMDIPDDISRNERVDRYQDVGNALRKKFGDEYVADRAIERIAVERDQRKGYLVQGDVRVPLSVRRAYLLDSLKNPAELKRLRQVYGDLLWVISVFAPEEVRHSRLTEMGMSDEEARHAMKRDFDEEQRSGQKVSKTAHQGNYFIRNSSDNRDDVRGPVKRFLETIFGVNLHTPTADEKGMMEAASAAVRSACLSRQVGAAIYDKDGDLLGVGCNDVPKFGGGLYSENNGEDSRCFRWRENECHNDKHKKALAERVAGAVEAGVNEPAEVVSQTLDNGVSSLIEFSRSVHAEMEAIVSVARLGTGTTAGSVLYTTTFPCHNCARHIVAAGVEKVIYVEPYSKSLALNLHSDSISMNDNAKGKVRFLQYEGFAPRTSLRLFSSAGKERKENGKFVEMNPKQAKPVFATPLDSYTNTENLVIKKLNTN